MSTKRGLEKFGYTTVVQAKRPFLFLFISTLSEEEDVWFHLVGSDGQPFMGTSCTSVPRSKSRNVDKFRDAVKLKNPNKLAAMDPSDLVVYKNLSKLKKGKDHCMKSGSLISGLGTTEEKALLVVVPPPRSVLKRSRDEMERNSTTTYSGESY